MKRIITRFAIVAVVFAAWVPLNSPAAPNEEQARKRSVSAPRPAYPFEARKRHWGGTGLVVVDVNVKTGLVVGVHMLKSTGHAILDHSAVCAFTRWHFKPGTTAKRVKIPISFTPTMPSSPNS